MTMHSTQVDSYIHTSHAQEPSTSYTLNCVYYKAFDGAQNEAYEHTWREPTLKRGWSLYITDNRSSTRQLCKQRTKHYHNLLRLFTFSYLLDPFISLHPVPSWSVDKDQYMYTPCLVPGLLPPEIHTAVKYRILITVNHRPTWWQRCRGRSLRSEISRLPSMADSKNTNTRW